jgi:hypothetical protein
MPMKTYRVEKRTTKVSVTTHVVRAHDEDEAKAEAEVRVAQGDTGKASEELDPGAKVEVRAIDVAEEKARLDEEAREEDRRRQRAEQAKREQRGRGY